MNLNLSSRIALVDVPQKFYNPTTAIEYSEMTRMEKIPTDIFPTINEAVINIAKTVIQEILSKQSEGKYCVLGLGTGNSLTPVYSELIRRHKEEKISFSNVIAFNTYEYYPLKDIQHHSSISLLKKRLLDHIDIASENIFSPDGTIDQKSLHSHCSFYENKIADYGGIDILLLGIGRCGNIATNEPGSTRTSTTRLMLLNKLVREEMSMSFQTNEPVPPCAITMGISTMLNSKRIFLTAWGEEKAEIIYQTVEGKVTDVIPASCLQTHNNTHVVVDLSSASKLTRIVKPWLVTSCIWTDKLVRSALVWLCQITGKPILKLTNKDYNENGLSELLALYGSAYNANIKVFNDLQRTITGWPGGKPNADDEYRPEREKPYPKRVLVFSPHPDDDVISMGGTIQRLVKQQHDIHIAYQTSGNIAVGDEEVMRFLHFINGFNQLFSDSKDTIISLKYREIKRFLQSKKTGELDSKDILTIKGLIRRGEARTACTFNKIPLNKVHFLDLPFYESGKIEKLPVGEEDVRIVMDLIKQIKPHQIYVAGDLADPHGTHKKCTDVVLAALNEFNQTGKEDWLQDCRIWMYRGAWAEWEIENIEMCVPMSPEELLSKRKSILKHQSQMESAPFLGDDERLFWQRSEDRNRATAKLYHALGLPCYEAMEAFVEYKL
ncbi:MAG: glucosamine-6-phosphate deaminase [Bacteroidales bacterium]